MNLNDIVQTMTALSAIIMILMGSAWLKQALRGMMKF